MNLIDDEFVPNGKNKNTNKTQKIVLISIIALVVLIIITLVLIVVVKKGSKGTKVYDFTIDEVEQAELKEIITVTDDEKIYAPIKDIATYFQYNCFNGNYINKSEDTTECYVETTEEVAAFKMDSNILEKYDKKTQEKTYYTLDEKITLENGKLYVAEDALQKAFNIYFYKHDNKIEIYTMNYLVESYKETAEKKGFTDISSQFDDKKAILESLLIVKNDKSYGVMNVDTQEMVLEAKYSKISYIPTSNEFLVENNGKMGIMTAAGKERIRLIYESIELVNQELNYYVVKIDGKYGVINENEEKIVPLYCDSIGVELRSFQKNNLKNKYVLLDKIIPVKRNDLWGLFDINGKLITSEGFEDVGCTSSRERNAENLLIIPEYNIIIVKQDGLYYLLDLEGTKLWTGFDSAYMTIEEEKVEYCVTRDGKTYNAVELIEEWYKRKGNNSNNE